MSLSEIKQAVQEISDAIAAVLQVDVTISDDNLIRVASTGKYRSFIGERLPENCSFEQIALSKTAQFIRNPNSEECTDCSSKGSCNEMATLGYPIMDGNRLVGVIGLIAFNQEQKDELFDKFDSLMEFLSKISKLLLGSLKESEYIKGLKIQDELINVVIDNLDRGIICTNTNGSIQFINSVAVQMLRLCDKDTRDIEELIPNVSQIPAKVLREFKLSIKGQNESFILSRIPILYENRTENNLYVINRSSKMIQDAYSIMNVNLNISYDNIIGESREIRDAKELAKNVSKSKSTVILRGESGTGKELFARSIHNESPRKHAPFIAINCASIPENLLESELFGYDEGAFTGASKSGKIGKFELANNGTLFLDEIGDLPIHLQPKLLRVLQDECFTRLGGKDVINVNFRLITATNRNLEDMVEKGQFRDDLYYRLNVIPIEIPPLRQRGDDINILSEYGLKKYLEKLNKSNITFSEDVKMIMRSYPWPGNIRELENCIEYMVNTVNGNKILKEHLPRNILSMSPGTDKSDVSVSQMKMDDDNPADGYRISDYEIGKDLKDLMDDYEKYILQNVLKSYGASAEGKVCAAKALNINLATLYRKLKKYNLQ